MVTKALALGMYIIGAGMIGLSLMEDTERFATAYALYGIAAWVFALGCGAWHISHLIEKQGEKPK